MSRLSSAFIQAVKASLDLGLVRMTGPPLTDETIEAAKQGDAAAFEEMMAWYEPISLNQREEHDVIKEILSTAGLNETADNPPVVATGEKSNHVVTTDRLPRFLSMARHGRMAATIIEPPTPYPVELICADSPVTPVESNLIVALVRWDDVEGFGEADLTRLLARIKGKLEATWSLFDGDDYAHKNPASGELKIVLLGRVGDATVSLTMKDGRLQHSLRDEDLPILGSASRILLLDEKAWAIDVQSVRESAESAQPSVSLAALNVCILTHSPHRFYARLSLLGPPHDGRHHLASRRQGRAWPQGLSRADASRHAARDGCGERARSAPVPRRGGHD